MSIFKASFPDFVQAELKKRQERLSDPNKRHELAIYQSTRNAFVRMTSGVNVNNDGGALAKKYVLQGGTLENISPGVDKRKEGVGKSFNSAYGIANASGEKYLRGIKPMPGIVDMSAECKTAYGSLIEATVKFVCWDIKQLEDLELLFMRPGYTVLLEWGWSYNGQIPKYYDILSKANIDFNKVNQELFDKCKENNGNYEAILGYVKNYQWSARPDGGYDCTTYIISLGEVLESLKMNYAPLNIDLKANNSFGILKEGTYSNKEKFFHSVNNFEKIKDYYSKGILSGLLYEIQLFMNANALYKTPDATLLNGAAYPDLTIGGKNYHVFKKQWSFKNKNSNPPPALSAVADTFNYYITLESLCDLVNTYVLPSSQDSTGDKTIVEVTTYDRKYQTSGSAADGLKCIAHPLQISTDPGRCLIKGDVWITGQTKGITPPTPPTPGPVSPEVLNLVDRSVILTSITNANHYNFLKAMSARNYGVVITNSDARDIFKKIRSEIIYSISRVELRAGGYYETITSNKKIINFSDCNGQDPNTKQLQFDIIKFLGDNDVDTAYNRFLKLVTNDQTIYDTNTSFDKNNNVQFTQAVRTFFINTPKQDVLNLMRDELLALPLEHNGNLWGDYLKASVTSQVVANTISTAKEVLKGLGSLREYFANNEYSLGNISNFYLDIDNLHAILSNSSIESKDPQGKNTINVLEFFKVICQTMQDCTGNINNFDIHIDGRDNKARIVDLNITPDANTSKLFPIEVHNLKSTVRNYKLESKIFPEQGAIIAISAQDFQSSGQLGYNNSTLTSYNRNITDRLKPRVQVPATPSRQDYVSVLLANFSQLLKYFSALDSGSYITASNYDPITGTIIRRTPSPSANNKYAPGSYNNALRDMLGFFSLLEENPNRFSGIIPVTLSLDMDGFGGAVIGNLFKVNEEILPKGYKFNTGGIGRQLGFLVKGFNHMLANNDWVTTIDAYPFIIPSNEEIKINNDFWAVFIEKGLDITTITPFTPVASTTADKAPPSGLVYPFIGDYVLTSPALEARISPTTGELQVHGGSDLALPSGTNIVAVDDGEVIESAFQAQGAGNYIKISHTTGALTGLTTTYMHLTKSLVKKGDKVKKSQLIGTSGNTGGSTGPHLHFEIRNTATQEKIKPNTFFPGF